MLWTTAHALARSESPAETLLTTRPEAPHHPPTGPRGVALNPSPAAGAVLRTGFRPTRLLVLVLLVAAVLAVSQRQAAASSDPPTLLLPWQHGVSWQTGIAGFHNTNDAIDFFPPDTPPSGTLHCEGGPGWVFEESAYWTLASAPGTVAEIEHAFVLLDHGNGWFSRYYHLSAPQVSVGDQVVTGQRLGHPSTLGECSTGPHVHYWVIGPDGETTRHVSLSGRPSTSIGIAGWIRETFNYDPGVPPHTPGPTPEFTPDPTDNPTPVPTDEPLPTPVPTIPATPTPTPIPAFAKGDANCDGTVSTVDAVWVLRYVAGVEESKCVAATAEMNCDGAVTAMDAIILLQETGGLSRGPAALCIPQTPHPTDEATTPTPGVPVEDDDA